MRLHTDTLTLGIDAGSIAVKVALLNQVPHIMFSDYERYYANIWEILAGFLKKAREIIGLIQVISVMTGSGGLTLSSRLEVPFIQEMVTVASALLDFAPQTDVAIKLRGGDAKIIYFTRGIDQRMNGICARSTDSFIDQMVTLLQTGAPDFNDHTEHYKTVYPIAARCGISAKSDIQSLINEGATKEDLAASIFQAVVNQTISGPACGKPIQENVIFLGGPLHFLPQFRENFTRTPRLTPEQVIAPDHSHLFTAVGATMNPLDNQAVVPLETLIQKLFSDIEMDSEVKRTEPLFKDQTDYDRFCVRHASNHVKGGNLVSYERYCYLGIDTDFIITKTALTSEDGTLLHRSYDNSNGSPLTTAIRAIREIKEQLPETARIAYSCSTGYGEALLRAALMLDESKAETISYCYAIAFSEPGVGCILDIGGQDMKYIKIKDGTVDSVQLNETYSSDRDSFIEIFAKSLNYSMEGLARGALFARNPTDLGTRCMVFMSPNIKQAQKEGAIMVDISASLAYSVIKNTLFRAIKTTNVSDPEDHIVVWGDTLYNNVVLRNFEEISECQAVRPNIAGIMGAFGAVLAVGRHCRMADEPETSMLSLEKIVGLKHNTSMVCRGGCNNHCVLTTNQLGNGRCFILGSRCEGGLGLEKAKKEVPSPFDYKYHRMFGYGSLPLDQADRDTVGIPRVLSMYENLPFQAMFSRRLRYHVVLPSQPIRQLYELGIKSTPSESECYPVKLVHGHVTWLIKQGVKFIFYPCIPYECSENPDAGNHYNCPIVASYMENIKNNVEALTEENVRFMNPFMVFTNEEVLTDALVKEFSRTLRIPAAEVRMASHATWQGLVAPRGNLKEKGEKTLVWLKKHGRRGIVLAGRPYHVDPEIHRGIPELTASYGFAVLTENSVSHLGRVKQPLVATDQWMYRSRLHAAVNFVKTRDSLDLIQLSSFGCGLDAVITDQAVDILIRSGKIHTVLKIDEVNSLRSVRIRTRSPIAAIKVRDQRHFERRMVSSAYHRAMSTKEMKKDYTLLCPQMSPIRLDLLRPAIRSFEYKTETLQNHNRNAVGVGLQYVDNDICYPSLIVIGQIMDALLPGKYDLDYTAALMSQTDGGYRVSNYVGFIRRALGKVGMPQMLAISVNADGVGTNLGSVLIMPLLTKAMQATAYGDIFTRVLYTTRPYGAESGSADALHEKWKARCIASLSRRNATMIGFGYNIRGIIQDFDTLPRPDVKRPKVDIVGEIPVKFSPLTNDHTVELLESEDAEAVMPDLMDLLLYSFCNSNFKVDHLGSGKPTARLCNAAIALLEYSRRTARKELTANMHSTLSSAINELAQIAKGFVSLGNQTGERWFLTGKVLGLIRNSVNSIIRAQSFGCLPNHTVGKGVIKELRWNYPQSNIVAADYGPGASGVNQLNKIKLVLATVQENLEAESSREDRGNGRRPVAAHSPCLGTISHT